MNNINEIMGEDTFNIMKDYIKDLIIYDIHKMRMKQTIEEIANPDIFQNIIYNINETYYMRIRNEHTTSNCCECNAIKIIVGSICDDCMNILLLK
jgi:hypothetical protein